MSEEFADTTASAENASKKAPLSKVKVTFEVGPESWITRFQDQCKQRGARNIDISDILLQALSEVPDSWWLEKLEELTPLEFRINAALADPNMREKLQELLATQMAKMTPQ